MTVCPLLLLLSAAWEQLCSWCLCRPPWPWAGNSQCVGALRHCLPPLWHLRPHLLPDRSTVVCTLFSHTTAHSRTSTHIHSQTNVHTHSLTSPMYTPTNIHTHTHTHTHTRTHLLMNQNSPLTNIHTHAHTHTHTHTEFSGSTCIRTHSLRFHCHKVWPAQSPTGAVVDGLKYIILTSNNYSQE